MSTITGGALLARCLAAEGVGFVFGIPCPEADPLLAALAEHDIRFVPIRHEAAGAHMAEGLYKSTGQVAVVFGNPGPGSANLLPGVITARHEGVPLLVLTLQHRLGLAYPSLPSTFQGQDQLDPFAASVKWGAPVLLWERLPEVARTAFREMWLGRPGPVQLEIPGAVMHEARDESEVVILSPERYRAAPPQASMDQLEHAADILAGAKHPLVVAGSGVDCGDANDSLAKIADLLDCPVIPSMSGRAVFPTDDPRRLYVAGPGADLARREADAVLVVGTRLGNLDLPYDKYWGDPASQQLVQIDVDARSIGVTRPVVLGIVAEAGQALEGLADALEKRGARSRDGAVLARCREAERAWRTEQFAAVDAWSGDEMHPARALEAVGRVFGRDAIYVVDGGNTSLWAHWYLPATRPRSYHNILELGMLGTGIPSAIGAKLGSPKRDVVCVTGDGAAGFNFLEMQSAAREGISVTVVVFAEGSWTMEEMNPGGSFGTRMGDVRWDIVGTGLGCSGSLVETLEELEPALETARATDGPSVVCVRTSCDANRGLPPNVLFRFAEVYSGPLG